MAIRNQKFIDEVNEELFNQFFTVQELNNFESLYLISELNQDNKNFKELLKKDLKTKKKAVFIASNPDDYEYMDKTAKEYAKYFKKLGLSEFQKIDNRMTNFAAINHIGSADLVFLMGGNPVTQLDFIKAKKIDELITGFKGTIIGLSAGAMNLGKKVFWSKDEDIEESLTYEGLGVVDITVDAHFRTDDKTKVQEFLKCELEAIGLPDESFIRVDKYGIKTIYGTYYIKENDKLVEKNDNVEDIS